MGIFAVAALAGFLLFGWIKASPEVRDYFLKPWVQGLLGLIAFVVLVRSVWVLITLPTLEAVQIAQDLTGPEVVQLILGMVFGCLLRYWWPQFWVIQMPPGTRYNWVAISLIGLLLLAPAIPYIERQFGGMTGLKTPFAEFQFAGTTNVDRAAFERERDATTVHTLPAFARTGLKVDLGYLKLFQGEANTITDHSDKKDTLEESYRETQNFIEKTLVPLADCAFKAYQNDLDIESIRHALSPVAQSLRLLIQAGQSQDQSPAENLGIRLENQLKESLGRLKKAFLNELQKEFKKAEEPPCTLVEPLIVPDPKALANTPHIHFALARLDTFNDNREIAISILKRTSKQFGYDRKLILGIFFYINYTLAHYLYETEHAPEEVFLYLDTALEIAQNTRRRIEKWEESSPNHDQGKLRDAKKKFEQFEKRTKNALAYFSARVGLRKFEALRYAEENYDDRGNLSPWLKLDAIETYGYVKMAFAAKQEPPDFDEIKQAKALFQEALSSLIIQPDTEDDRNIIEYKRATKKTYRSHLEQADRLLASR